MCERDSKPLSRPGLLSDRTTDISTDFKRFTSQQHVMIITVSVVMVTHHQWGSGSQGSSAKLVRSARVGGAKRDRRSSDSIGSAGSWSYTSDGRGRVTGCILKKNQSALRTFSKNITKHCVFVCVSVCVTSGLTARLLASDLRSSSLSIISSSSSSSANGGLGGRSNSSGGGIGGGGGGGVSKTTPTGSIQY